MQMAKPHRGRWSLVTRIERERGHPPSAIPRRHPGAPRSFQHGEGVSLDGAPTQEPVASASPAGAGLLRIHRRSVYRLVVATALAMVLGCEKQASEVSLDELARNPSIYRGHPVSTVGGLRFYPSPPHYWIESAAGARVEVIGLRDPELLLGAELRVTGRFRYSRARGRRIEVESQALRD